VDLRCPDGDLLKEGNGPSIINIHSDKLSTRKSASEA